ncbi:MotA/TolQ/ExbB proton channel family protein [Coraliomargarita sp. SDUM461003]|uniref:MotA/TolQ/ExbB proton channel family protein n=1 Tax=Thalassobacterium maritimum TaxID=3041265 RepID=A0ABU1APV0_9BACT|nr:MotA/TolQ/ExbB proton channel family protein [Coraliomargarita sp. SDUM461003]MDQ8206170.1 MotA/TolQ/ExbB proton channel family protein [Coraliomargarita sp. SDUM461003]
MDIFTHAGIFIYPLGLCSILAVFIAFERLLALRPSRVMPRALVDAFVSGQFDGVEADQNSVAGRILHFHRSRPSDPDSLKAYARLEVSRMERGVFLLEVVIGAAPLIGLLGTVTGLTQVFSGFSAETGLPDPATFIRGIALALNTTILGLAIAIPALAAHAYVLRRVEFMAARIGLGVQALLQAKQD